MGFSGSRALSEAFELFKSRFGPMLAVSLLYYVLLGVVFALFGASLFGQIMAVNGGANPAAIGAGMGFGIFVLYLAIYGLQFFHQAALVRLCSDRHEPSLGEAISIGLRCVPTLFGVAILMVVALFAIVIAISLLAAGTMMGTRGGALTALVPLVLLIGLGYLAMRLSMILPVIANEDERNPITAIRRSWALTRGSAFKLFLLFVLVLIVMGVIAMVLFSLTLGFPQAGAVPAASGMIGFFIAMVLFGLSLGIYFIALIAAIHRQLASPAVTAIEETFA